MDKAARSNQRKDTQTTLRQHVKQLPLDHHNQLFQRAQFTLQGREKNNISFSSTLVIIKARDRDILKVANNIGYAPRLP
ncbi:putative beta-glucosidase M [Venturia inaequalis]|nr:putative beta-glucosidase M [Venturia inaequalis]